FPSVKNRSKTKPFPVLAAVFSAAASMAGDFPLNACFTVAIRASELWGPHPCEGTPFILLLCVPQGCRARLQGWAEVHAALIRSKTWKRATTKKPTVFRSSLFFQRKTPMPCHWPVLRTQPSSRCSASTPGAELVLRARFFRLNPGPPRGGSHGPSIPVSVRLARPRPPNLESKYQWKSIFCQEKNAKCG